MARAGTGVDAVARGAASAVRRSRMGFQARDERLLASPRRDAMMTAVSRIRTTLTIDEEVLRAVKVRAARSGKGDSQVIEDALRRDLGLDLLERLWKRNDVPEDDAEALAIEAQHKTRRRTR